jgi:hypothetical protein
LGWQVAARGGSFANAYAVRLADQVRSARAYSETITGLSPDEIVTASSFTEPSLAFSLGTDTVLGTAEEVLAFAESRVDPTMIVLDLSRDADLRSFFLGNHAPGADLTSLLNDVRYDARTAQTLAGLSVCHRTLANGTNYARGSETTLVILHTNCASPERAIYTAPAIASGGWHSNEQTEDTPDDPQD